MYRVTKVLNHNAVLVVEQGNNAQCLLLGKGIGFGKKISETIDSAMGASVYYLQEYKDRGGADTIIKSIDPEILEIANQVLDQAESVFGTIDRSILFPLADHIYYAVERIKKKEQISNPLTEDIRLLFHMEYKVAACIIPILQKKYRISIGEDEVGYIALHVHSAIDNENVSDAIQIARAVRACVQIVEEAMDKKIDVLSLSYNRLMNHVRYMIVRAIKGEKLKMSLNDYMSVKYPSEFNMARTICDEIAKMVNCTFEDAEIGYLAMHICRVTSGELDE